LGLPLLLLAALLGGCVATHPDFTGLWQNADPAKIIRPDVNATEADYTAEAWASIQDYVKNWNITVEDPANFCVKYGMPNTMSSRARTYVMDIYQTPKRITVIHEYMDNYRIIHFDTNKVPDGVTPSNNGYSVAHWEGNTLVIDTTALKARPTVERMQRSELAHITERWNRHVDPEFGQVLEVDMTVEDPKVFRHPVRAFEMLKQAEAGAQLNEYACPDTLWDDHLSKVLAERAQARAAVATPPAH
jgi:hypothetical protein